MTLSVVMPNFNHSKYLRSRLDEFLSQSFQPLEILIIDDASTDDSVKIIEEYQKRFPIIQLTKNLKNIGPSLSANLQIIKAKGDYVFPCSVDDVIFPGFFEKMMEMLTKNPTVGLCFTDYHVLKEEENIIEKVSALNFKTSKIFQPQESISVFWKSNFTIPSHVTIYKRELIQKYLYTEDLKSISDFYLNCQVALRYPVAYIPEQLGAFRVLKQSYGQSIRWDFKKRFQAFNNWLFLISKQEDKEFRESFRNSGLISFGGKFLLLYLFLKPRYWNYFFVLLKKKLRT